MSRLPPPPRPGPGRPVRAASGSDARDLAEPARHRLYLHVAWTTLDELPLVGPRQALALEGQLVALCRRLDVEPLEVAVDRSRVHLLVRLKPVHAVSTVVRRLKDGSTEAAVRRGEPIRWGRGWAAATVAPARVRTKKRRLEARSLPARQLTAGLRGP